MSQVLVTDMDPDMYVGLFRSLTEQKFTYTISPVSFIYNPRKHNQRKNGGKLSYHLRIQKKWDKRYGVLMATYHNCYPVGVSDGS